MLFERQKTLLALIDVLGGRVGSTDLQKLLFLWAHDASGTEPAYDFVPYRFGACSFTSYADKRKLVEKGLLADEDMMWAITPTGTATIQKEVKVRARAAVFVSKAPEVRGDALVALTYRRHPFFAIRSEIAARLLADDAAALERIEAARPGKATAGVVTIGYEGRSVEGYLVTLMKASVSVLCDVRRNPISRRYGFAKSTLSKACENVGIQYAHLPGLGIASAKRQGLDSQADYDALFRAYERDDLPHQTADLTTIAQWVEHGERVALTCFERLPHQCHRHCVADALARAHGTPFIPVHL